VVLSRRILIWSVLFAGLLACPGSACAAMAPGRVIFPVDGGVVSDNVDGGGASQAVVLADGGAVLVGGGGPGQTGFDAAKIGATGGLDPAFGTAGVARLTVSSPPFEVTQLLLGPGGKLIVVGSGTPRNRFETGQLLVVRLNADGSLDRSFGSGGIAAPGIEAGCGRCSVAALQPDGGIVVTGATGEHSPSPNGSPDVRWVVARLTSVGALDRSFGQDGLATIPVGGADGLNVAVLANGTILTEGQTETLPDTRVFVARLTATGASDSTFGGGSPVEVPFSSGFPMLVRADGSVVVAGQRQGSAAPSFAPGHRLLARYTPSGDPDQTFGSGGVVDLGTSRDVTQVLPDREGLLVVGKPAFSLALGSFVRPPETLDVERITPDGRIDPSLGGPNGLPVTLPFGGGGSSFVVSVRPRPLPLLAQNSFAGDRLVPRPDGSYLVVGGVTVSQPLGEGEGRSIYRFAAAALTPSFALAPGFGGTAEPLRATVRLVRQRAATDVRQHGVRVALDVSAPGLCRVKIKFGRHGVAQSVLPIFQAGKRILPVELTRFGNGFLRRHRHIHLTLVATARDLLTATATAPTTGTLR
jgi:uncharacterized delta-60 repeat protein